ncbi:MAG: FUSC family protein [bacterium]
MTDPAPEANSGTDAGNPPAAPHHGLKKALSLSAATAVIGGATLVPVVIAALAGYPQVGTAMILPVVAGLIPSLLVGVRTGLVAAAGLAVASGVAALVHADAVLSALLMAAVALIFGLSCHWGVSKNLLLVPISVGFFICLPPSVTGNIAGNAAALALVTFLSAAWGCAVGWVIARKVHTPDHTDETWARTWSYAITVALLTGIAAYISVSGRWGQAGAWFILTLLIVFQPYLADSWRRTWQRAAGTLLGLAFAYVLHLVIPWQQVLSILGLVLMVVAMNVLMRKTVPYWIYTSILTPAIILLVTTPSTFTRTEVARLIATLSGAALAVIAEAVLLPLYRRDARRHGKSRY